MTLDLIAQATFAGPAFTEPFVRYELEHELAARKLLPREAGAEGRELQASWETYRRYLRELVALGGAVRVRNHVLEPLVGRLGYTGFEPADDVATREGQEPGGTLMLDGDGNRLRTWATDFGEDLDAPARRGRAYRFSHSRIAQRVLLAAGEQVGLLTNGLELRLLISNSAGRDSLIEIHIDPQWKRSRDVPDTYRLLLALASPAGIRAVPDLVEKARLQQTRVTKELRVQARQAVERFVQEVLDHPDNAGKLSAIANRGALARQLWHEGLVLVYRLLFILKSEASDDPAQGFSFASTSLWRNTFSPSVALAPYARAVLDEGTETGGLLEGGLRSLFRMFEDGLSCTELNVKPLGGFLFGANRAPLLSDLRWSERSVAHLLDRLLWTSKRRGSEARERVHYGPLDVKDLGRVYEALLELEPGIAGESMCRLRRRKLEVVIPLAQGVRYQVSGVRGQGAGSRSRVSDAQRPHAEFEGKDLISDTWGLEPDDESDEEDDLTPDTRSLKPDRVEWVEEIPPGRFYLRVGLGRKSSGSFYTPDSFVTFLVQETLGPLVERLSPHADPRPLAILSLKVGDDACGSGHFLVESDRFLGDKLYEACRACDERALEAERRAEGTRSAVERQTVLAEAAAWRQRVAELPDPNDELLTYLPSRAPEGAESGLSQRKALALCKRLVAVHCLYGVDKNPLAVELARLALWIETQAEGLPLTFLDHRIVVGDSLTGPFFEHLLTLPGSQKPLEGLWSQGLTERFTAALGEALAHVRDLEATVGATLAEIAAKQAAKARLDRALALFRIVAAAWAGGVMLGPARCDDEAYRRLVRAVAEEGCLPADLTGEDALRAMIACGLGVEDVTAGRDALLDLLASGGCVPALPFELVFPEVFFPTGDLKVRVGFDVLLGNPPWDKLRVERRDLMASVDPQFLAGKEAAGTGDEHKMIEQAFQRYPDARRYEFTVNATKAIFPRVMRSDSSVDSTLQSLGDVDQYRLFLVRGADLGNNRSRVGMVLGGGLAKNPADAPMRRFAFSRYKLTWFIHYLNLRQLFGGASSRISFVLIVGNRADDSAPVRIGYELLTLEDLLTSDERRSRVVTVERKDVWKRINSDGDLTKLLGPQAGWRSEGKSFLDALTELNVDVSNDINRTTAKPALYDLDKVIKIAEDARHPDQVYRLLSAGYACCYDGRSIDFYDSLPSKKSGKWYPQVTIVAKLSHPQIARVMDRMGFYRMAWRATCGHTATNARSARACLLPPGTLASNSILLETAPRSRPNFHALIVCTVLNSFTLDFQVRPTIQANLNKAVIDCARWPSLSPNSHVFLVHQALRLSAINRLYSALWREQLGDAWREPTPPFTWPVLAGDDARWAVRAAIDAVVSQAYGLDREQYAHVLSTFSHKSYPKAPALCLARFDELMEIGLDAFTRKWDPYWDVPLNEGLPEAVIEIEGAGGRGQGAGEQMGLDL